MSITLPSLFAAFADQQPLFRSSEHLRGAGRDHGVIVSCINNNRNDSWGHAGRALSMLLVGFATAKPTLAQIERGSHYSSACPEAV